jgi:hypothetical protein
MPKVAQSAKIRPIVKKSPNMQKVAQSSKSRPLDEKSPKLVTQKRKQKKVICTPLNR